MGVWGVLGGSKGVILGVLAVFKNIRIAPLFGWFPWVSYSVLWKLNSPWDGYDRVLISFRSDEVTFSTSEWSKSILAVFKNIRIAPLFGGFPWVSYFVLWKLNSSWDRYD